MFIAVQKVTPQHLLTKLMGWLAKVTFFPLKNAGIRLFIKRYNVDMSEAVEADYKQYPTFNAFFTRHLKPGARPIATDSVNVVCPVDGVVSELGKIKENSIYQAKGIYYDLSTLLGGDAAQAEAYQNGYFMTAYLAPRDYHRIHMPLVGKLKSMTYIPGRLFSVNPYTASHVKDLFAVNERVVCEFETERGLMSVIAVGAMIVGSVVTAWHGEVTNPRGNSVVRWDYDDQDIVLGQGEELGYFQLGSTVVVLLQDQSFAWQSGLHAQSVLRMGQSLGRFGS